MHVYRWLQINGRQRNMYTYWYVWYPAFSPCNSPVSSLINVYAHYPLSILISPRVISLRSSDRSKIWEFSWNTGLSQSRDDISEVEQPRGLLLGPRGRSQCSSGEILDYHSRGMINVCCNTFQARRSRVRDILIYMYMKLSIQGKNEGGDSLSVGRCHGSYRMLFHSYAVAVHSQKHVQVTCARDKVRNPIIFQISKSADLI